MNKNCDIALNTVLPTLGGASLYFIDTAPLIRNYLPDGLWAYALSSSILVIWDRRINGTWLMLTACLFVSFEWLQAQQFIRGTGDLLDTIVYCVFGIVALLTNNSFKQLYPHIYEYKN